ncbi:lytic transglycosylase domain-containing protein [candidate division KSB1 bacterium]|nr:lytic transglycosylase domain-containing protein [candidate division KSB1 bacterium]RQW04693.1 MAG: lytic transglycosylase [candidate division KSB1 bacterium]
MEVLLACIGHFIGRWGKKQLVVTWGVASSVGLVLFGSSSADELFPIPPQIEKNVDFWTKIYSQYSSNHVVIHDRNDLAIIYKVINLDNRPADSLQTWQVVEDVKDRYRLILQNLAQKKSPVHLDSLTAEERHVYILWSQHDEPQKFASAIYAVRAQVGLRDHFEESIKRAGYYKDNIEAIFRSYDLPLQLTYLPHVESLFNFKAYSKVGAAGVWQFMRYTGRLFMTIDAAIDERLDPLIAADGAAQLLKKNYDELQSWPLAITAYNHGVNGMLKAREQCETDDFGIIYEKYSSPMFSFASKNFYAEFLAAWHVAENHAAYFDGVQPYPAIRFQTIQLPKSAYLKQLAEIFQVPIDTLIAYNPAFQNSVILNTMPVPKGYELRLPYREGFDPHAAIAQNITKPLPAATKSRSRSSRRPLATRDLTLSDSLAAAVYLRGHKLEAYIIEKLFTEPTPNLLGTEPEHDSPQPPVGAPGD